jgi:transcriptional regulator with XRE-family HTH domain
MTARDLAAFLGLTSQRIVELERAEGRTLAGQLIRIAAALETPASYFVEEVEKRLKIEGGVPEFTPAAMGFMPKGVLEDFLGRLVRHATSLRNPSAHAKLYRLIKGYPGGEALISEYETREKTRRPRLRPTDF